MDGSDHDFFRIPGETRDFGFLFSGMPTGKREIIIGSGQTYIADFFYFQSGQGQAVRQFLDGKVDINEFF